MRLATVTAVIASTAIAFATVRVHCPGIRE